MSSTSKKNNHRLSYDLLNSRYDNMRDSLRAMFSEYLKWYFWFMSLNLTGMGAALVATSKDISTHIVIFFVCLVFVVINIGVIFACLRVLKSCRLICSEINTYSDKIDELCYKEDSTVLPDFKLYSYLEKTQARSIYVSIFGLIVFACFWLSYSLIWNW